jgi:hypothetical protein
MRDARLAVAHRAVLDHVLGLVMGLPWSDSLVLRGSVLMRAWVGEKARDPADLDFVMLPDQSVPIDPLDPHPYVAGLELVRQWPEVADGAGRYEIWCDGDEEFCTGGVRAIVPPEGLYWQAEAEGGESVGEYFHDLAEQVRLRPQASPDLLLEADRVRLDDTWTYAYGGDGLGGFRVVIPWRVSAADGGELHVDFALDERLPDPPIWTLIPRGDGRAGPRLVQAASPELALAWKLLWLRADSATDEGPQPKDLIDAVLLAEDGRTRLSARLLRKVLGEHAPARGVSGGYLNISAPAPERWAPFAAEHGVDGTAEHWLDRLSAARLGSPSMEPAALRDRRAAAA